MQPSGKGSSRSCIVKKGGSGESSVDPPLPRKGEQLIVFAHNYTAIFGSVMIPKSDL